MTAVLKTYRLKPANIAMCEGMPFQQHFECRIDRPLDDLDLNECFADLKSMMDVGDQVTICAYMDNQWQTLMEIGVCRIVEGGRKLGKEPIRAVWVGSPIEVPKPDVQRKAFKNKERPLYIKKEFGGGFTVQDDKGNVIERVKTKAEAEDYVARLNQQVAPKADLNDGSGKRDVTL